jgi:TolA-binding protein
MLCAIASLSLAGATRAQDSSPQTPAPALLPAPEVPQGMVAAGASDVQRDFARAQTLMQAGKEDDALVSFSDFLRRYPNDALSDDAQFAIGDLYFRRRKFDVALREFRKVLDYGITKSDRIADAGVRMGECFVQLREPERAQIEWEAVRRRFPKTEAAARAGLLVAGLPK